MKNVAISIGDPFGIGPELLVRSLVKQEQNSSHISIYANANFLLETAETLGLKNEWIDTKVKIIEVDAPFPNSIEELNPKKRAQIVFASMRAAIKDCLSQQKDTLLTLPIDKSIIRTLDPSFMGHTEYLAEQTNSQQSVMMMINDEIQVALLSNHIPLRDVPVQLSKDHVLRIVRTVAGSYKTFFDKTPSFALCGINPHAGETSSRPEEQENLIPALEILKSEGINIDGPFAADSLFPKARKGTWDIVLCSYHDQGLVAVKYPGLEKVVNITLGLPFLRVSPGHGVAYDVKGTGLASLGSFQKALRIAQTGRIKHVSH